MKISELIARLESMKELGGDVDVVAFDDCGSLRDVQAVYIIVNEQKTKESATKEQVINVIVESY